MVDGWEGRKGHPPTRNISRFPGRGKCSCMLVNFVKGRGIDRLGKVSGSMEKRPLTLLSREPARYGVSLSQLFPQVKLGEKVSSQRVRTKKVFTEKILLNRDHSVEQDFLSESTYRQYSRKKIWHSSRVQLPFIVMSAVQVASFQYTPGRLVRPNWQLLEISCCVKTLRNLHH